MKEKPWILVNRFPYEEPYHTELQVQASNGRYTGDINFYCAVDDLQEIGQSLIEFPSKVPDEYRYEYGSDDPTKRWYSHFMLRAYTTDAVGHCALQLVMNLNRAEPDEGSCSFSIKVEEAAQICRLGRLFQRLREKPATSFRWTLASEEFVDL